MSIDRLSALSAQIAALRAEMSRKSGESRRSDRTGATRDGSGAAAAPQVGDRDPEALRKQLIDIVRGIAADDPDARARARERVIKAVLLWEFGQEMREHPEWRPMVETIARALGEDARMRGDFDRMIVELGGR